MKLRPDRAVLVALTLTLFCNPVDAQQKTLWEAADLLVGEKAYEQGNYKKAADHFRKAFEAKTGWSATAAYYLGLMHANGQGVKYDSVMAAQWFRRGAEGGEPLAQQQIAMRLSSGLGVPKDYFRAYFWANLAAARLPLNDKRQTEAAILRDHIEKKLSSQHVAEAQKASRDWMENFNSNNN